MNLDQGGDSETRFAALRTTSGSSAYKNLQFRLAVVRFYGFQEIGGGVTHISGDRCTETFIAPS
jgi:hypothetical protein